MVIPSLGSVWDRILMEDHAGYASESQPVGE